MRKIRFFVLFSSLLLVFLYGCVPASAPKVVSSSAPNPPKWVLVPPAPDGRYHYFVGIGSGPDLAKAREAALASAMVEVLRYMGVKVEYEYEKEKLRKGGEVSDRVKSYVKAAAEGRIEGMEIQDAYYEKWVEYKEGKPFPSYTYYVLIRYSDQALEREKQRIRRKIELEKKKVYSLLKDAEEKEASGDYWKALIAYSSAVSFSRKIEEGTDIEAKALDGIKRITSSLKLVPVDEIVIKGSRSKPFRVKLLCSGKPVPSAPLRYRVVKGTGKVKEVVYTDSRGIGVNVITDFSSPLEGIVVRVSVDDSVLKEQLSNATDVFEIIRGYTAGLYLDLEWKGALKAQRLTVIVVVRGKEGMHRIESLEASLSDRWKKMGYDVVSVEDIPLKAVLRGDFSCFKEKRIRLVNVVELKFSPIGEIYGVYTGKIEGAVKLVDAFTSSVIWSKSVGPEKGAGISFEQARDAALERIEDNLISALKSGH